MLSEIAQMIVLTIFLWSRYCFGDWNKLDIRSLKIYFKN